MPAKFLIRTSLWVSSVRIFISNKCGDVAAGGSLAPLFHHFGLHLAPGTLASPPPSQAQACSGPRAFALPQTSAGIKPGLLQVSDPILLC